MPDVVPRLTMRDCVGEFVPDGQELYIGGFAFSDPMALANEIVRQGRTGLEVYKTSGGVLVDLLIGAGCIDRLLFCHVWNSVGPEPAHAFRRAIEDGHPFSLEIEELSFGAFTMALAAGAWGLPFMPTTPLAGTGHDRVRRWRPDKLATVTSPFDGRPVNVVEPLRPALGVFHVQRVDEFGNGQMLGPTAEFRQAIPACQRVVLIAEELVATEVVRERPELTVAPSFMVDAVVIEPWAAHPTDSAGYYRRDLAHHELYGRMTRTIDGFEEYLGEWVKGPGDHSAYVQHLGEERLADLALRDGWGGR